MIVAIKYTYWSSVSVFQSRSYVDLLNFDFHMLTCNFIVLNTFFKSFNVLEDRFIILKTLIPHFALPYDVKRDIIALT